MIKSHTVYPSKPMWLRKKKTRSRSINHVTKKMNQFKTSSELNIPLRAGLIVRLEKPIWEKQSRSVRYGRRSFRRSSYTEVGTETVIGYITRDSYGTGHDRWDGSFAAGQHTFTVCDAAGVKHLIKGRHAYGRMNVLVRADGLISFKGSWVSPSECQVNGGGKFSAAKFPGVVRLVGEIEHALTVEANRRSGARKAAATRKLKVAKLQCAKEISSMLAAPKVLLLAQFSQSTICEKRNASQKREGLIKSFYELIDLGSRNQVFKFLGKKYSGYAPEMWNSQERAALETLRIK